MFKFITHKWLTIVGGLMYCACMTGCMQSVLLPSSSLVNTKVRQAGFEDLFLEPPAPQPIRRTLPVQAPTIDPDAVRGIRNAILERGREAFSTACTQCHEAEQALVVKQSYNEWIETINEMAAMEDAEIQTSDVVPIATYLSSRTDQEIEAAQAAADGVDGGVDDDENDAPAASADMSPETEDTGYGQTAFRASCLECHDANRSLSVKKSFDGWMSTIRRMAAKEDADINSSDFAPIARYLAGRSDVDIADAKREDDESEEDTATEDDDEDAGSDGAQSFDPALVSRGQTAFNKSCLKCHDAQRSLSKKKSLSAWRATVKRMAAKDGADVRPSDFEAISVYLASESAGGGGPVEDGGGEASPWTFSTTLSTLQRSSSDTIENPGFFVDAWVGADWQSDGPLRATVMACTSCHSDRNSSKGFTFELVEASATLDLKQLLFEKYHSESTKKSMRNGDASSSSVDSQVSTSADLKMGRFVVPFGAYSAFSHPGAYRTLTNPLMFNMGRRLDTGGAFQPVLPGPYSDEGLNLRLALREYCDRSYTLDLFAVNGLQGSASGANFNFSRSYSDSNRTPAVGGRYTLGNQVFRFGASGMLGQMQNDGSPELDYHLIGADALVNMERFRAYFEYAFRREQAGVTNNNEIDGYVIELEWKLRERLGLLTRYDTLDHQVASAGEQSIDRFTWGVNLALQRAGLLLLNHEHWMLDDRSDVDVVGLRWVTTF